MSYLSPSKPIFFLPSIQNIPNMDNPLAQTIRPTSSVCSKKPSQSSHSQYSRTYSRVAFATVRVPSTSMTWPIPCNCSLPDSAIYLDSVMPDENEPNVQDRAE